MSSAVICIDSYSYPSSEGCSLVYFDGVAYTEKGMVISPQCEAGANEIKESDGEWILIERGSTGITVYTDIHGYYTIFYSIVNHKGRDLIYLGNTFSNVCAAVNKHEKYEINIDYCLPMLASYSPFFNTSHSLSTTHIAVKKLAPLKKIIIREGEISIENDDRLEKYSDLSYEELLMSGLESITKTYKSFVDNCYKPVFYLSGGKDSRACLSACGDISDSGFFFSQNPNKYNGASRKIIEDDYNIASSLSDMLGLKRFKPLEVSADIVGYDKHNRYISKRISNRSNVYTPSIYLNKPSDFGGIIEIRGGGGEVLRSYWSSYFEKIGIANKFVGENGFGNWKDFSFLFNKLVSRSLIGNDALYKSSQNAFVEEMLDINKSTACETLEEHYFLHRNRYHFGHLRESFLAGKACYFPLSNKFLYLASKKLSFDDRKQGRLLYDIIKNSKYDLDSVEYESGDWEWESSNINDKRFKVPSKEVDESFYPPVHMARSGMAPAFDKQEYLNLKFEEISARMREDEAFSFVGNELHDFLKNKVNLGGSSSSQVIQKLFSMIDATSYAIDNIVYVR